MPVRQFAVILAENARRLAAAMLLLTVVLPFWVMLLLKSLHLNLAQAFPLAHHRNENLRFHQEFVLVENIANSRLFAWGLATVLIFAKMKNLIVLRSFFVMFMILLITVVSTAWKIAQKGAVRVRTLAMNIYFKLLVACMAVN